jgi:hypothetical protein
MGFSRWVAAAAVSLAVSVLATGTATAGETWTYRASGSDASVEWIEFGDLPGIPGNVHVGWLWVDASSSRSTYAYGYVEDWTCPEGERPDGGGHDEEEPGNCEFEAFREIEGEQINFTMDRKLSSARLTGTLRVENHETGAGASPPVDITWTAVGSTHKTTETYRDVSDGQRVQYRNTYTSTVAVVDGFIGAMGFTDDQDDESSGYLSTYRVHERSSSK